jgi:hypothetical protein
LNRSDVTARYATALAKQTAHDAEDIANRWRKLGADLPEDKQMMMAGMAYQLVIIYLHLTDRLVQDALGSSAAHGIMDAVILEAALAHYRFMGDKPQMEGEEQYCAVFIDYFQKISNVLGNIPEVTLYRDLSRMLVELRFRGNEDPALLKPVESVTINGMERLMPDLTAVIASS